MKKQSKLVTAACALLVLALGTTVSSASTLALYVEGDVPDLHALPNMAPTSGYTAADLLPVGQDSNITRSSYTAGTTTPAGPTMGSAAGSEWLFVRSNVIGDTPNFTDDYYAITLTADAGNTFNLTSLVFDYAANCTVAVDRPADFDAQTFVSVDGGAFTAIGAMVNTYDATIDGYSDSVTTANIDLSSITGASTVELRIGTADNYNYSGNMAWMQGITVTGDVIPEPATIGLLGLSAAALVIRRRFA